MKLTIEEVFSKKFIKDIDNNIFIGKIYKEILIETKIQEIDIDENQKKSILTSFAKDKNLLQDSDLKNFLKSNGITINELEKELTREIRFKKYILSKFNDKAYDRFKKSKESLNTVEYELIRVKNKDLALEIYFKIENNEELFSSMVEKYSGGYEKKNKGRIGPISLSKGHPELIRIISKLSNNELALPFQLGEWWLILRLIKIMEATFNEETKFMMCKEVFEESILEEINNSIKTLRSNIH